MKKKKLVKNFNNEWVSSMQVGREGYSEEHLFVDRLIHGWAESSANKHPLSIALQLIIKEEFDPQNRSKIDHFSHETVESVTPLINAYKPILKKFIHTQYNQTQELLTKTEGDSIILYRGMTTQINPLTSSSEIFLQPASSFSRSYITANDFSLNSGTILISEIPKKNIFSTWVTGFGCLLEEEMVVLGNQPYKTFILDRLLRQKVMSGVLNDDAIPGKIRDLLSKTND